MAKRILASDYLKARGDAFNRREHMDVIISDLYEQYDIETQVLISYAFMAGSDWEREYRGRRYTDEKTAVNPHTMTLTLDATTRAAESEQP